ncbi:MAG: hypothetical protein V4857_17290 [Pseudomonadota bacterium]
MGALAVRSKRGAGRAGAAGDSAGDRLANNTGKSRKFTTKKADAPMGTHRLSVFAARPGLGRNLRFGAKKGKLGHRNDRIAQIL